MPKHALLLRDNQQTFEVRDAIPRPATFDATARTVEAVVASAAPVQRQDARGAYLEILEPAGLDIAASRGASVLDSHQQQGLDNVLGTLDTVRVEGNEVVGLIRFSTRPEIAAIVDDVRSGVIQHLSVGYQVETWRDGTDANGNRTRTAVKWIIRECSFVSVPADRNARTRNLPLPAPTGQRAEINQQIRALATRAGIGADEVNSLIDRNASVADARQEILFELQIRSASATISSAHNRGSLDNPEAFIRAAGEALYMRVAPSHQPSGMARQFVGMTTPDLARECLRRVGSNVTGLGAAELVTRALQTTSDYPLLLADTVGRTLRESYQAAPSGIRQLCRQTTVPDFRMRSRLMLDSTGFKLERTNEAGEYKYGSFTEAGESYRAYTYGKIFTISRAAIVNDDLSAFSDVSRRLGAAAAAFEAQQLVDLLVSNAGLGPTMSDAKKFFHTDHGNLDDSGAAPDATSLDLARLALRRQTSPSGELINIVPQYVLVPPELETATEKELTAIQAVQVADVNVFSRLTLVVEPRLLDPAAWYVVAPPAQCEGIEYCYLAGSPGPQTESRAGFEIDGLEVKIREDFGCGAVDWRPWFKNPGKSD
jgi:phage head maturation protease